MSSDRYFFCHIPKTAGTSAGVALERHFGEEAIYPLPDDDYPDRNLDVDHLRTVFEARGDQIKVITGHFPLCVIDLLGEEFRTFTILRDPVARTLSHLRYQRTIDSDYAGMSLPEAYGVPINLYGVIHNMMVKMLGMQPEELTAGVMSMVNFTEEHLVRAKAALDAMEVVGVQARYDSFVADLNTVFGWDVGDPVRVNTTDFEPVEPEFTQRILRDNQLDVALYRYAEELVSARSDVAGR